MPRFYRLAKGEVPVGYGCSRVYEVAVCFEEGLRRPVWMGDVAPREAYGGSFSAVDVLRTVWDEHFRIVGGEWLRPYLARMAAGEVVTADELLGRYALLHSVQPETFNAVAD